MAESVGKSKVAQSLGMSSQTLRKYLRFAVVSDTTLCSHFIINSESEILNNQAIVKRLKEEIDSKKFYDVACCEGETCTVTEQTIDLLKEILSTTYHSKCLGGKSVPRMNSKTMLFCHMELKWNDKDPDPCRDEVQNNPESIRKHMIKSHGWKKIPELAQRECKNAKDEQEKYESYLTNPAEWFFDNQLIWSEFRNSHFRKTVEVESS